MEELRNEIWDFLFKSNKPQPVDKIAMQLGRDRDTIGTAVHHEWFQVSQDEVSIAYATGPLSSSYR